MSKILSIAFGSPVPAKQAISTDIHFSGYQFQIWAVIEMIACSAWYLLHRASFVFAVSHYLCSVATLLTRFANRYARF
jgi:hypothetical protein